MIISLVKALSRVLAIRIKTLTQAERVLSNHSIVGELL
jgi:hypothetical protein